MKQKSNSSAAPNKIRPHLISEAERDLLRCFDTLLDNIQQESRKQKSPSPDIESIPECFLEEF